MNTKIKIGMIGLGARGIGLLQPVFLQHPDVRIEAVCDVYQDRCESAAKIIQENGQDQLMPIFAALFPNDVFGK